MSSEDWMRKVQSRSLPAREATMDWMHPWNKSPVLLIDDVIEIPKS